MESSNVNISPKEKSRRPLHILQPAANDNETLVGVDRMIKSNCQLKEAKSKVVVHKTAKKDKSKLKRNKLKENKAVQTERQEKVNIEVTDLTSTNNPSENYWQVLAEKRRVALENTLAENKRLEEHIENLEENLHVYKEMLDETKTLVEVLQEMIQDNGINLLDDSSLN